MVSSAYLKMELNNDFKGSLVNKRLKKFLRHSLIIYAFFYYNSWLIDKMYLFVLKKTKQKKTPLGARHGYISWSLYCKSIRKSIFDKCKKRFVSTQFDFSSSINIKADLILPKLVLLLCSVVKSLNEYIWRMKFYF